MENYVWAGVGDKKKFHLVKFEKISRHVSLGCWGIYDLATFSRSLLIKNLWRDINTDYIWHQLIESKYLKHHSLISWIRAGAPSQQATSLIWRSLLKITPWLLRNMKWIVGNGAHAYIGMVSIINFPRHITLSPILLDTLHNRGFIHFKDVYMDEGHEA